MKRICVYCASSPKVNKAYFDATEKLAKILIINEIEVIYGGGSVGLMAI
jgi:predicted Rossmann-fold nucleotide-binding protein